MRFVILAGVLLSVVLAAARAEEPAQPPAGETSKRTPGIATKGMDEPEITIIESKNKTIEEYRINGQLYMIKVTPKKGPPYYIIDTDGDGILETRRNDILPGMMVPQWTLFRWK